MKLVCSQAELNASLQLVSRAISSRPSHPILACVLLSADAAAGRLSLTGYNLSLGIVASVPASIDADGAAAISAQLLGDIVSRLPSDSPITIDARKKGRALITSVCGSYELAALDPADYPDLPQPAGEPMALDADALARALRATLFASSTNESKQILTGVHLQLDDAGLECAATDGHRLAVLRVADDGATGERFELTIPARSCRELERLIASCPGAPLQLRHQAGQLVVRCGDQLLTSRSLDGTYPNYRQLIPPSFSRSLQLDRRRFSQALERVAVLADQHSGTVKLRSDPDAGTVTIAADAQDVGSGSESMPVVADGDPIEIAFNVRYVLDGLKAMGAEQVVLRCNAPTTPAVLSPVGDPDGFIYLVMPIQIRS
jgi:DNA polymerase-3 subunit beta